MKALITASGQIGPFSTIIRTDDNTGWLAGDCIYPDGVIGEATVGDYVHVPTTAELNAPILAKIAELEEQGEKPRRRREAITTADGKAWMVDLDARIAALRGKLVK